MFPTDMLLGARRAFASWLLTVPHGVREALLFFFILFLLRALLRNQWLGAAAFVLIWTAVEVIQSDTLVLAAIASALYFAITVIVVLRWGLLALCVQMVVNGPFLPRADAARLGLVFGQRRPDAGWSAGLRGLGVLHVDAQPRIALAPLIT